MDFKWFEDFLSLTKYNNFSRAAQDRHITQSAFSRRIKALEFWLGLPLVDRSCYPISLTPAGKVFAQKAQEIVSLKNDIKNHFNKMSLKDESRIKFLSLHTIASTFFPKWLIEIEQDIGPINTTLQAANMNNCIQGMLESSSDFFISLTHPSISASLDTDDYLSLVIGKDRLIPVSAPDKVMQPKHTLVNTTQNPTALLIYPDNAYFGCLVNALIKHQGITDSFKESYVSSFADAIRSMALEGSGLAWLPESMILDDLNAKRLIAIKEKRWVINLDIRIYRHKKSSKARVEIFWDYLLEKYQ